MCWTIWAIVNFLRKKWNQRFSTSLSYLVFIVIVLCQEAFESFFESITRCLNLTHTMSQFDPRIVTASFCDGWWALYETQVDSFLNHGSQTFREKLQRNLAMVSVECGLHWDIFVVELTYLLKTDIRTKWRQLWKARDSRDQRTALFHGHLTLTWVQGQWILPWWF